MDLNSVLKTHFVQATILMACGDNYEVIKRPQCFTIRSEDESKQIKTRQFVERIILLPPRGYTANERNQTNSHDEAKKATIEIKGAVREDKKGYSTLKKCLLVASFRSSDAVSELNKPYLVYDLNEDNPDLDLFLHSSKDKITVVSEDGHGFYHNLINMSDEWLVLQLRKTLRPQRGVELNPVISNFSQEESRVLRTFYNALVKYGDTVFSEVPKLVDQVLSLPPEVSLHALGEMLFAYDTGKHEACTAFAMILKIGKIHRSKTIEYLESALKASTIPQYYALQLLKKMEKFEVDSVELNYGT